MSNFAIDWTRHRLQWHKNDDRWVVQATLVERIVLDAAPRLKIVCNLARIDEDRIGDTAARESFWHAMQQRLGRMFSPRDRDQIEALIAEKVPRPMLPGASTSTGWRSHARFVK